MIVIDFKKLDADIKAMEFTIEMSDTQGDNEKTITYLKIVLDYMKFLLQLEQEREIRESTFTKIIRDIVREEVNNTLKRGN